jgi:ATP-dependent Clp protease ATP-binding subunit ClpC
VRIQEDALEAAVELSERHLPDRCLPGKAIHVIDEAGALVRLRTKVRPAELKELELQIEELTREKEEAVAEQDFAKAAHLRDQADQLDKRKLRITFEWHEKAQGNAGTVDKESIAAVIRMMTGTERE